MNPMKAQVKMLTVEALGNDMDDLLEGAQVNLHKAAGGVEYLAKANEGLKSISARVDKDLDDGKITDSMKAMDVAKYVKKMLGMAGQSLNDVALQAQTAKLAADGQVAGIKKCVGMTKKVFDEEALKLEAYLARAEKAAKEAAERGEDPEEAAAPRPRSNGRADDLAARKAAAKAAKAKAAKKTTKKRPAKKAAKKKTVRKKRGAQNS